MFPEERMRGLFLASILGLALIGSAAAQTEVNAAAAQGGEASEREVERYRAMISDPMANPGYLSVDRGEALWAEARGTKAVSLEACDLGRGPGVLEGAYAALPRWF